MKRSLGRWLISFGLSGGMLLLGGGPIARAGDSPDREEAVRTVSAALSAFHQGTALLRSSPEEAMKSFRAARDGFQAAIDAGHHNGRLFYNLGNTQMRLGQIGEAIAAYSRAERLMPHDERLKANLRFARSLRRDQIAESGERALLRTVFAWHYALAWRTRLALALATYGLFWLLLAARTVRPTPWSRWAVAASLVLWLVLTASVGVDWPRHDRPTEGVLVQNDVVVRRGDGEGYDPQFAEPLHEGVEFKIAELRRGWVHIELPNGQTGWIRESQADLF